MNARRTFHKNAIKQNPPKNIMQVVVIQKICLFKLPFLYIPTANKKQKTTQLFFAFFFVTSAFFYFCAACERTTVLVLSKLQNPAETNHTNNIMHPPSIYYYYRYSNIPDQTNHEFQIFILAFFDILKYETVYGFNMLAPNIPFP